MSQLKNQLFLPTQPTVGTKYILYLPFMALTGFDHSVVPIRGNDPPEEIVNSSLFDFAFTEVLNNAHTREHDVATPNRPVPGDLMEGDCGLRDFGSRLLSINAPGLYSIVG